MQRLPDRHWLCLVQDVPEKNFDLRKKFVLKFIEVRVRATISFVLWHVRQILK